MNGTSETEGRQRRSWNNGDRRRTSGTRGKFPNMDKNEEHLQLFRRKKGELDFTPRSELKRKQNLINILVFFPFPLKRGKKGGGIERGSNVAGECVVINDDSTGTVERP